MKHSFLLSEFYFNGQSLLDCPVDELRFNKFKLIKSNGVKIKIILQKSTFFIYLN